MFRKHKNNFQFIELCEKVLDFKFFELFVWTFKCLIIKNVLYNNLFIIFLIFYKQNWVTLCKSQIYSMPEIFFLSPDSRVVVTTIWNIWWCLNESSNWLIYMIFSTHTVQVMIIMHSICCHVWLVFVKCRLSSCCSEKLNKISCEKSNAVEGWRLPQMKAKKSWNEKGRFLNFSLLFSPSDLLVYLHQSLGK